MFTEPEPELDTVGGTDISKISPFPEVHSFI